MEGPRDHSPSTFRGANGGPEKSVTCPESHSNRHQNPGVRSRRPTKPHTQPTRHASDSWREEGLHRPFPPSLSPKYLLIKLKNLKTPAPPQRFYEFSGGAITISSFVVCHLYYGNNDYILSHIPNRRRHCNFEQALQTVTALSPKILT